MRTRTSALTAERANVLGAHAAESENQIRFALRYIAEGDIEAARASLKDAEERMAIVRLECYWEPSPVVDATERRWWAWHDAHSGRWSASVEEAEARCAAWVAGRSDDGPDEGMP